MIAGKLILKFLQRPLFSLAFKVVEVWRIIFLYFNLLSSFIVISLQCCGLFTFISRSTH